MPTNLSVFPNISPKGLRLTALFLLSPLFFFGQSLTGLWTGALSNDSSTVRKDQSFEIALTEYKGKVYGYSRSEFIVDDTLYYIVKRVKGTIDGDVCEVTDDEIVSYNFRGKIDKGIKVTSTFRRNQNDSTWYLDGTWKTNATKKYYSVTGKVNLAEEKDLTASKIFPHLEELNLANDVAFYKERKEEPSVAKLVKPEKIITEYSTKTNALPVNDVAISPEKPNLERAESNAMIAEMKKPVIDIPVTEKKNVAASAVNTAPTISPITAAETNATVAAMKKPVVDIPNAETKNIVVSPVTATPVAPTTTVAENNPVVATLKKPALDAPVTETKNIVSTPIDAVPSAPVTTVAENKAPVRTNPVAAPTDVAVVPTNNQQQKQVSNPVVVKNNPVTAVTNKPVATTVAKTNTPASAIVAKQNTETKKQDVAAVNPVKTNTVAANTPVQEKKEVKTTPVSVVPEEKKPVADIIAKSAVVAGRKSEFSQVVSFKSDSLELSLYDNGEIDGDTVSIFMNGEVILSKQGLKGSAIKKTIYITPGNEDFTLVLFAENLGKYPPNTGLLVVHDGDDVYNLRFSSDFQKSTGIVFRRKK